jgi:aminoglycoside 3-N-acetyltransferase I
VSAVSIRRLQPGDVTALRGVNALFAEVFEDLESYSANPPDDAYLGQLLSRTHFVVLVAESGDAVVGALAGYELEKFEQARSEYYIYDLGVSEARRRQGIATRLIEAFCTIAGSASGHVVFVQADYEDPPAIALYEKLGRREDVLHFDIAVTPPLR